MNIVRQASEHVRYHSTQFNDILPPLLTDPRMRLLSAALLQRDVALDEEVKLFLIEFVVCLHDLDRHLEGEEQFVTLKQT